MSLSLDGSTRYVGTEFIKLLNTGSSNLATEEFVTDAVAGGGGGGGAVDAYTKTETDNLLDTKLNINNPQNMEGTLNIGSVGGTSKIIINALSSTKDFYVNGDSQVLGNHLVQSLDSTSYIKGTNLISNTINADNVNDIFFQSNGVDYLQLDVSENKLVSSKLIQCGGNLTTQENDTIANLDLVIKRNGVDYITLADGQINFNQPSNISVDTTNLVKKTGETDQRVDGTVSINGDTVEGYELTVAGQVHTQGMFVASNTNLIFGNANRYITNPPTSNHIRHYTNGEHQFYCNGVEDFLIDQDKALARGNMLCVGQFQGIYNSFNNTDSDVEFRKANSEYIKLGGAKVTTYFEKGVASNIYDSVDNADVAFKRNFVDFFYLRNNTVDLNAGISLSTDGASINELSSKPLTDFTLQRAGTEKMKIYDTYVDFADDLVLKQNKKAYFNVEIGKDAYIHSYVENSTTILGIVNKETMGQVRIGIDDNVDIITVGKNVISLSEDVSVVTGKGIHCDEIFCNIYDNRYSTGDIVWQFNNVSYMFYDYSEGKFKFLVNVESNEQISANYLKNNVLEQISDKRLKDQIEDVETDCIEIVKKVPVKKFVMKEDKKKKKQIGFIAQDVEEAIPDDFENIVIKNEDGFFGMDYTKTGVILWKCCQEQQSKIEHLESRLFEVENFIRDHIKPKPRAKTKVKNLSIDYYTLCTVLGEWNMKKRI